MADENDIIIGETILERCSFTVTAGEKYMKLPRKEFMLLYEMASAPGKVFSKDELLDNIWGSETETDIRTIDVHIGRLRKKFQSNRDFRIITIRGAGYMLEMSS